MENTTNQSGITEASSSTPQIIHRGKFRYPPGLRFNLPLYAGSSFFDRRNPILLFEHLQKNYGRAAHYRLLWHHIVLLNDPADIREVLIDKARFFVKERTQKRMKMLLGEGLITSDGEIHRRHRVIAAPAFHRQRIQAYAATIVEHADVMRRKWQSLQPFDMAAEMMRLSLQITARTLFDTEVTPEIETINDESNAVMEIYNDLMQTPSAEQLFRWKIPLPVLRRFRRSRNRLDAVVNKMIAQRQAQFAQAQRENRPIGSDLLSMLIAAHDDSPEATAGSPKTLNSQELRDEVMTIFLAGYETVANALAWTWFLLARNPIAEARLHAEIAGAIGNRLPTLEDLPKLPYAEAVLAESMRLYPPAWAMGRQATAHVEIGPYRLPKGSYLFFSQYIVQRDEHYFPDPLAFQPARFLNANKAGKPERPRFAYFPFGGGSRQCIGESFAWMEATLVLITLAQQWRFTLVPGQTIELQPKITLRPKYGIQVIPHPCI
ncbi:MAG TPA: cytochrome P450 [Acidobacteriaceae bacterium]|nr:cytochrome P450 [Acidobacteriaceae bacterium]